jgi:hypothetical protein
VIAAAQLLSIARLEEGEVDDVHPINKPCRLEEPPGVARDCWTAGPFNGDMVGSPAAALPI